MSSYADDLLAAERPRAFEAIGVRMRDIDSDAALKGATGNSRIFIEYQTAIVEGVTAYGRTLRERLSQFDSDHSPVSTGDFDNAIASIDALIAQARDFYQKRCDLQKPFGGKGLPIDEDRLEAAARSAKNELRGLQSQHASQRDVFKRWLQRGLDAFGQNLVFMGLWTIFAIGLGAWLGRPLAEVWEVLAKLGAGR